MAKVTEITPALCRELRTVIEAAVNASLKDRGLNAKLGKGLYTDRNITFKNLEIAIVGADGKVNDAARQSYVELAHLYDCDPAWLDKPFRAGRKMFRVVGLRTQASKNCIWLEEIGSGKRYTTSPSYVRTYIGGKSPKTAKTIPTVIIGKANPNHAEIERRIAEMRNDNPEGYYADGEHHAAGMTEKQIHDMHYASIARELANGDSFAERA